MDYNKLKFFVTVAENRDISDAAKVLRRTQSAVNQQVRLLEEELQTKLFKNIGKKIELTPEGQQIFELVRGKLGDIDTQIERLVSREKALKGTIRVGYAPDGSTSFPLFKLASEFRIQYPLITFEINTAGGADLEDMLLKDGIDMAILTHITKRAHLETSHLASARHILATSRDYMESKGPFPAVEDLFAADLVDFDVNLSNFREWLKKHSEQKVRELIHKVPVITVPNYYAVKEVVMAGHGVGIIPDHLISNELHQGSLMRILPQKQGVGVWLDLALAKDRKISRHEKAFIAYLKSNAQNLRQK